MVSATVKTPSMTSAAYWCSGAPPLASAMKAVMLSISWSRVVPGGAAPEAMAS